MKNVALTLMLIAGLSVTAQAATDNSTRITGDAEAGKAKTATCVACHGADGNGLIPSYPKIAGQHESYLAKQLKEFRLAGQTGGEKGRNNAVMIGMAMPLSDQDIADLSAFYASQRMAPGTTSEASLELGERLYRGGDLERGITACIACHGPRGNGTALSGFPKISYQSSEYLASQLKMFRSGERNNDMNAMMRDVSVKLTDADIVALSAYLGGLH